MKLDYNLYIHDSDRAALSALKAIPGFSQILKAFMSVWNEKQYKIINMSTNLKLGKNQLEKYYNMLPPICEKLGIEIPELYVELDVTPNAYTFGDTHPFIVVTSGLFETLPDELIPTVLAHECGHIVCHHTLYHTMGTLILNGALSFLSTGIANVAIVPIQLAFAYWMRCSEYSADRVAAVCDGNSDKVIEMCMRFAGYDKDIQDKANVDLFLRQADEYRELVENNAFNKTLEFLMFNQNDHPLNAVRAYESREWGNSDRFDVIKEFLKNSSEENAFLLPERINPKNFLKKDVLGIEAELKEKGFTNVLLRRNQEASKAKKGSVLAVTINGVSNCKEDWYKKYTEIIIDYYDPQNEEELCQEHLTKIKIPEAYKYFIGKPYKEIDAKLKELGFTNILLQEITKERFLAKANTIAKITINGDAQFAKNIWYDPDAEIVIYFYTTSK